MGDHDFARGRGCAGPAGLVISQVYGGGGNSGATYKNDFIELLNASSETINLAGDSVQYASSTGSTWQVTTLSGTLAPANITSSRKPRAQEERRICLPPTPSARSTCRRPRRKSPW